MFVTLCHQSSSCDIVFNTTSTNSTPTSGFPPNIRAFAAQSQTIYFPLSKGIAEGKNGEGCAGAGAGIHAGIHAFSPHPSFASTPIVPNFSSQHLQLSIPEFFGGRSFCPLSPPPQYSFWLMPRISTRLHLWARLPEFPPKISGLLRGQKKTNHFPSSCCTICMLQMPCRRGRTEGFAQKAQISTHLLHSSPFWIHAHSQPLVSFQRLRIQILVAGLSGGRPFVPCHLLLLRLQRDCF